MSSLPIATMSRTTSTVSCVVEMASPSMRRMNTISQIAWRALAALSSTFAVIKASPLTLPILVVALAIGIVLLIAHFARKKIGPQNNNTHNTSNHPPQPFRPPQSSQATVRTSNKPPHPLPLVQGSHTQSTTVPPARAESPLRTSSRREPRATPPLPQMVQQYLQWFKEMRINPTDHSEQWAEANHDQLVLACQNHGYKLLDWAEDAGISLKPDDTHYKQLMEVFCDYLRDQLLPSGQASKSLQLPPDEFIGYLNKITDDFHSHEYHLHALWILRSEMQNTAQSIQQACGLALNELTDLQDDPDFITDLQTGKTEHFQNVLYTIRSDCNKEALEALKPQISAIVGEDLTRELIENDVLVPTAIRLGLAPWTPEIEEYILRKVGELKDQLKQASQDLTKVRLAFLNDVPPNPHYFYSRFPVFKALSEMKLAPAEAIKTAYRDMINKAQVKYQLLHKNYQHAHPLEFKLIQALTDYNLALYDERTGEAVMLMDTFLKGLLTDQERKYIDPERLQENLEKQAFMLRMERLGFPPLNATNISVLLSLVGDHIASLTAKHCPASMVLQSPHADALRTKLPKGYHQILETKKGWLTAYYEEAIWKFIATHRDEIMQVLNRDESSMKSEIQSMLSREVQALNQQAISTEQYYEEHLEPFYKFYMGFIGDGIEVVEYQQGEEGDDTILGKGLCRAKAFAVHAHLAQHPEASLAELNIDQANARERMNQALFSINFKKCTANYEIMPEKICKQYGVKEKRAMPWGDLSNLWQFFNQKLAKPNTDPAFALILEVPGEMAHAIYVRFDRSRQRYFFYDSNHLIAVSDKGGEWLKDRVRDLLASDWPKATKFTAFILEN